MLKQTEQQLDALKEIVNIGVGKAAGILNEMLDSHIELEVPSIVTLKPGELKDNYIDLGDGKLASVELGFHGSFTGNSMLVFPEESAAKLVAALTNEKPGTVELDVVMSGTLNEIGNIVINAVMGSICNLLKTPVNFSLPNYTEAKLAEILRLSNQDEDMTILLVKTTFKVQNLQIDGNVFIIFKLGSFEEFLSNVDKLHCE